MDEILLCELIHDGGNAACLVEIRHVMLACRAELRDVRRAARNLVKERRGKCDSCLVCNRREVEHRIGRAANAHIDRNRVLECLARHDITWLDIAIDEVEDDFARTLREEPTVARIGGRNGAVSGKPHAEDFCQGIHRICCE